MTPHAFDNRHLVDEFKNSNLKLNKADRLAFRKSIVDFCNYLISEVDKNLHNVATLEDRPTVVEPTIRKVSAGVAFAGIVSSGPFLLGRLLGNAIRLTGYTDVGREAEMLVVSLTSALFPKVEGIIAYQYGMRTSPDRALFENYLMAQIALFVASLEGRADLIAEYKNLSDDIVQSAVDRVTNDKTLRFRFENHEMIGVVLRAFFTELSRFGLGLAFLIHGVTMPILVQKMHLDLQTGLDRIFFYTTDAAVIALCGAMVGGPLGMLGRNLMNRDLQHGETVPVSTPSERLPKAYEVLQRRLKKAEKLQELIANGQVNLAPRNVTDLRRTLKTQLAAVEQMRTEWDKKHAVHLSLKVQAGAATAARGGATQALSVTVSWLNNFVSLLGVQFAMETVSQALQASPAISGNSAYNSTSNSTYNATFDGMPGNGPNDVSAIAPFVGGMMIASLMFGRFVLNPLMKRGLGSVASLMQTQAGGDSPATRPASGSSGTPDDGSEPPTEDFPGLLTRFQTALQSIEKTLKEIETGEDASGNTRISEDRDIDRALEGFELDPPPQ